VWWERRAKEPIIPMSLFRNSIFTVSSILSLLAGIAMFAAILYLPLYQQLVRHYSPTESGLLMLPLVLGLLAASIISGRIISKIGKYKMFPMIGTLILALGLWMLSHLALDTSEWVLGLWMLVVGIGLGSFMQVMTLAIQNSVPHSQVGTATSSATFFRSIGSSFGGAIFGTILAARLATHLAANLPAGVGVKADINVLQGGAHMASLPPDILHSIMLAFTQSFQDMFLLTVPIALLAFVVSLFLKESPLKSVQEPPIGEQL
jgi:MFS family permease